MLKQKEITCNDYDAYNHYIYHTACKTKHNMHEVVKYKNIPYFKISLNEEPITKKKGKKNSVLMCCQYSPFVKAIF